MSVHYLHAKGTVDDILWRSVASKLDNLGYVRLALGSRRLSPRPPPRPAPSRTEPRPYARSRQTPEGRRLGSVTRSSEAS